MLVLSYLCVHLSVYLSVRLSIRMAKFGPQRRDLSEILYLIIFRKSLEKIQVSLKLDKNNGYFT